MVIKAVILAAGEGKRAQPITRMIPKPMMPLIRKPILASIIEHLHRYGINKIMITTSYLAPTIENYLRDGELLGVQIAYSFEGYMADNSQLRGHLLGSAGGIKRIQDFSGFFDTTFVAVCGDALIDVDLFEVLDFHYSKKALATVVLKDVPLNLVSKYGVVKTDETDRVIQFQEKPYPNTAITNVVNTGIYVFEPAIFDDIPSGQCYDIGSQLFPALVEKNAPFYGIKLPFQWLDIGSIPDYWQAIRAILQGQIKGYTLPGEEVRPGIYIGINVCADLNTIKFTPPVYIGSSTYIGYGATIQGPTVIGSNCVIEGGAVIKECLLDDYTRVGEIAHLERFMVFDNKCINPDGQSIDIKESDIGWLIDDARKDTHAFNLSVAHRLISELAKEAMV